MPRLIIHHWDTDGICAAALLYEEGMDNMSPRIGNYFLEEEEIERIRRRGYDEIWIVDVALHEETMKNLVSFADIRVFDHHLTRRIEGVEYINPILEGESEEEYPSASWVVARYLNTDGLLAFLGAVGDWEERIKSTSFYPKLRDFMEKNGLKFEELHEMVYRIDANYKAGDREEVERAVRLLHDAREPEKFIMENELWRRRKEEIEKEIKKAIEAEERKVGNIRIKEIESPYNIISTVARKIWNGKEYVLVINRHFFKNE